MKVFDGQKQTLSLSKLLDSSDVETVRVATQGRIFSEKNFAKDWNSIDVKPSDLDCSIVEKGMRKITKPMFVCATHKNLMAFVLASIDEPVYFVNEFYKSNTVGWIILLGVNPHFIPDYLYYMCKYTKGMRNIGKMSEWKDDLDWDKIGLYNGYDGLITPKDVFFFKTQQITIPSLQVQYQKIADAKAVELMIQEKMSEKWRKFEQKEWLNEAHIRNCKHRLSNEIMPIRIQVDRLRKFFNKKPEGVRLSDIIGEKTNQSISELLESLDRTVKNVEEEIEYLTKSEKAGESAVELDVAATISEYCEKTAATYVHSFKFEKVGFDKHTRIKISPKDFREMLSCIIANADRHGFIEGRSDYVLQISIEERGEKCRISFANNGYPMSERAINEYFVRRSVAGSTGNTGIGGARVFEICEKAGGEALRPSSNDDFSVVISVEFPLVVSTLK